MSKVENATQKANAKAIATECSGKKKNQQQPHQQRKKKTNRASCPGGN